MSVYLLGGHRSKYHYRKYHLLPTTQFPSVTRKFAISPCSIVPINKTLFSNNSKLLDRQHMLRLAEEIADK